MPRVTKKGNTMDAKLPKPKLMKAKIEIIFESRDTTVDQIEGYEDFYRSLLSDYFC